MFNTIDSDLIRGHIDTIILKALYEGDRYGFDIIKEVEQKSGGQYVIKQPTLYSSLKRLEVQGFIKSYWGTKSIGGRRKYFTLTDMGRELFTQNLQNWEYSRTVIDKLISDRNDSPLPPITTIENGALAEPEQAENAYETEAEADILQDKIDDQFIYEPNDAETTQSFNEDYVFDNENSAATLFVDDEQTEKTDVDAQASSDYEQDTDTFALNADSESLTACTDDSLGVNSEDSAPEDNATMVSSYEQEQTAHREIDTDEILSRLYEQNSEENSYIKNISTQEYTPNKIPTIDSNSYFTPLAMDEDYDEENSYGDNMELEQTVAATENFISQESNEIGRTDFLSYHSPSNTLNFDEESDDYIVERDYRKVLDALIEENTVSYSEYEAEDTASNTAQQIDVISNFATERFVKKEFDKLVTNTKDLGDDVTVKAHNSSELRKYSASHYYYSNQLRLYQFGILFALMLIQIASCFLIIEVGVKATLSIKKSDGMLYLGAILIALALPVASIIIASKDFYKRKKYSFSLKAAVIFRIIIAIQCIVIIYALNVYNGIITGNIEDYLSSLIMPSVLSLNFIASPLIFNALFKSKRFAVK